MRFGYSLAIFSLIFSSYSLFVSGNAHADTATKLVDITTDAFDGDFSVSVTQDSSGAVSELLYQTPDNPHGVLTLAAAEKGPQPLFNYGGNDVLFFSLEHDFDPATGGHANLRFLVSGLSGTYKNFRMKIEIKNPILVSAEPNAKDPISDGNTFRGPFTRLFLEKNTAIFGVMVGIKKVVPKK